jgi:hypothetical protein
MGGLIRPSNGLLKSGTAGHGDREIDQKPDQNLYSSEAYIPPSVGETP